MITLITIIFKSLSDNCNNLGQHEYISIVFFHFGFFLDPNNFVPERV